MSKGIYIPQQALRAQITALEHTLNGRLRNAVEEIREAVIETSIETAIALAARTFPSGYGFKLAKNALENELKQLYATGGRVYQVLSDAGESHIASAFYAAYKSGNLSAAAAQLRKSSTSWAAIPVGSLNASLHEKARNAQTGKIEVKMPLQIVPADELKFYTSIAIKRLGKTASGWNACAEALGGNGNSPKWKGSSMHGSDGGSVTQHHTVMGFTVILHNHRKLAAKHLSPGQRARILRTARRNLNDRLIKGPIHKIKRASKKAA
jgi:hypothetical protein